MAQALSLWSDLEQAFHGTNKYAGNTAEIYIHRLMTRDNLVENYVRGSTTPGTFSGDEGRKAFQAANKSLHGILKLFAKERTAGITVEDRELGPWLKEAGFEHRVHVKVTDLRARKSDGSPSFLMNADPKGMPIGNFHAKVSDKIDELGLDGLSYIVFRANGDDVEIHALVDDED